MSEDQRGGGKPPLWRDDNWDMRSRIHALWQALGADDVVALADVVRWLERDDEERERRRREQSRGQANLT